MAKMVSGNIAGAKSSDDRYVTVTITRQKKKGIFNKKLVTESFQCKMSEDRFEKALNKVERGTIRHLKKFERGEVYE